MRSGLILALGLFACSFDSSGLGAGPAGVTVESASEGPPADTTAGPPDPSNPSEDGTATTLPVDTDTGGDSDGVTGEPGPRCGDGVVDAGEDCDGAALGGASCGSLGFTQGTLVCAKCKFDTGQCSSPGCGDGAINGMEACDCAGGQCTAPQLNNSSCTSLAAPSNGNYSGGELGCDPATCGFDTSKCIHCGDGVKNAAEACDGADLGGASCPSMGFANGALTCTPGCGLDASACNNCGDGEIDAGEVCDGTNLDGATCKSVDDEVYATGELACGADCGGFSTGACSSGNCCKTGGKAACEVAKIRGCVCFLNPGCCNNAWDGLCVGTAKTVCGAECP